MKLEYFRRRTNGRHLVRSRPGRFGRSGMFNRLSGLRSTLRNSSRFFRNRRFCRGCGWGVRRLLLSNPLRRRHTFRIRSRRMLNGFLCSRRWFIRNLLVRWWRRGILWCENRARSCSRRPSRGRKDRRCCFCSLSVSITQNAFQVIIIPSCFGANNEGACALV